MSSNPRRRGVRTGKLHQPRRRPIVLLLTADPMQQTLFQWEAKRARVSGFPRGYKAVSAWTPALLKQYMRWRFGRVALIICGAERYKEVAVELARLPKSKVGHVVIFSGGMLDRPYHGVPVYRREPLQRYAWLVGTVLGRKAD